MENLPKKIHVLKEIRNDLNTELSYCQEKDDQIKDLSTKKNYFENHLLSAKKNIDTLNDEKRALQHRLNLKEAENENLLNENQQLKDEKNVNELLIEKTSNTLESNLDRLTSEKAEIENLRNQIRQLEEEKLSWLKSEANRMNMEKDENDNLRNQNRQLEAENNRLQSEWLQHVRGFNFTSDVISNSEMSGDCGNEKKSMRKVINKARDRTYDLCLFAVGIMGLY